MFSSRGTVRYEERAQGYRDVEKVGKHWSRALSLTASAPAECYSPLCPNTLALLPSRETFRQTCLNSKDFTCVSQTFACNVNIKANC